MTLTHWQTGVVIENPAKKLIIPKFKQVAICDSIKSCEVLYSSEEKQGEVLGFRGSLFDVVDACFSNHWGLSLSPDVFWFIILEQITAYIKQKPKRHRSWFVDSEAKKDINIFDDQLAFDIYEKKDWNTVLPKFKAGISKEMGEEKMQHLLPQFSLEREESEMALIIAMMDAVSVYYQYNFMSFCGIPKIRLQGCREDWVNIKRALSGLEVLSGLKLYFSKLETILDKFIDAFDDKVDQNFFRSIYKKNDESGGPYITGWFPDLFAFDKTFLKKKKNYFPWWEESKEFGVGMKSQNFPCNVTKAQFTWEFPASAQKYDMRFLAGIFFSELDEEFVTPRLHYVVGIAK